MSDSFGLFLMSEKGLAVLEAAILSQVNIRYVVVENDKNIKDNVDQKITELASSNQVEVFRRNEKSLPPVSWRVAVSWRWMIENVDNLYIFHDSILPKYRGFAPLVSSLINGEDQIGVTCLSASKEYDAGEIVCTHAITVEYPIKIAEAIHKILPCYKNAFLELSTKLQSGSPIKANKQMEKSATYSLWLDDSDYLVNWNWSAEAIRRFVDAVGHPYKGAHVIVDNQDFTLVQVEELKDVTIENRKPGKVIFIDSGKPVVVCGTGLIKIHDMQHRGSTQDALPLSKFRTKFTNTQSYF